MNDVNIDDVRAVRYMTVAAVSAVTGTSVEEIITFLRRGMKQASDDVNVQDSDQIIRFRRRSELELLTAKQLDMLLEHFEVQITELNRVRSDDRPPIESLLDVVCSERAGIPSWCDVLSYVVICEEIKARSDSDVNNLFSFWCDGARHESPISSIANVILNEMRMLQRDPDEVKTLIDLALRISKVRGMPDIGEHIRIHLLDDPDDSARTSAMLESVGFRNVHLADVQLYARACGHLIAGLRGDTLVKSLTRIYELASHDAQSWNVSPTSVVKRVRARLTYVQRLLDLQPKVGSLQFRVFCVLLTTDRLSALETFERVRFANTNGVYMYLHFKGRDIDVKDVTLKDVRACLRDLVNCGAVDHTKGRYIIR